MQGEGLGFGDVFLSIPAILIPPPPSPSFNSHHSSRLKKTVDDYMAAHKQIEKVCRAMASTLLIDINSERVYHNSELHEEQTAARESAAARLAKVCT